jgi:hypothetical protein
MTAPVKGVALDPRLDVGKDFGGSLSVARARALVNALSKVCPTDAPIRRSGAIGGIESEGHFIASAIA